jgi:hypothetical protein
MQMAKLVGLTHLETSYFAGPQGTGAWPDRIAAMTSVRYVRISGARVGDEAIERLHRSRPEVYIYVDGRPR